MRQGHGTTALNCQSHKAGSISLWVLRNSTSFFAWAYLSSHYRRD